MAQQTSTTTLHLVLSIGYATDLSLSIIAAPIAVFRRRNDAVMTAQAEQELGEVVVEGYTFKQRTTVVDVTVPGSPKEVWAVWSNAYSKDGTGNYYGRVDGVFVSEEAANEKLRTIEQGEQNVKGCFCNVISDKKSLAVR